MKIARRFTAGVWLNGEQVPKGRLKKWCPRADVVRPCGTLILRTTLPELKPETHFFTPAKILCPRSNPNAAAGT
jgi:hypothetical protein